MEWMGAARDADAEAAAAAAASARSKMLMERFHARQEARKRGELHTSAGSSPPAGSPTGRATATRSPNTSSVPGAHSSPFVGKPGKYVPPAKRANGLSPRGIMQKPVSSPAVRIMQKSPKEKEALAVRIGNLTADADKADVEELCRMFGSIRRIFVTEASPLAEQSPGFALVTFVNEADAKHCIQRLNGHGYGHRVLKVDWAS